MLVGGLGGPVSLEGRIGQAIELGVYKSTDVCIVDFA